MSTLTYQKGTLYAFGLGLLLATSSCGEKGTNEPKVAPTKQGYDLSKLDTTVHPCDNFYRYAAGGWMDANPVPDTESRWGVFNVLAKQNDERLRLILEELRSNNKLEKGSVEQLTRDLYLSALDTATLAQLGAAPLMPFFQIVDSMTSKADLGLVLGRLKQLGLANLFSFYVNIDAKNSTQNIVHLAQGGLSLPDRDYYLKQDERSVNIRKAYVDYMQNVLTLAGFSDAIKASASILEIETLLAQNSMSKEDQRDPDKTYNKFEFSAFVQNNKAIDWEAYFSAQQTAAFESLIVSHTHFYKELPNIIKRFSLVEWQQYLKWQITNNLAGYLSKPFEEANFGFYATTMRGTAQMKPRWEKAVSIVNSNLGEPMGQLFVAKHFSADAKAQVGEMVEGLRDAFKERIAQLDWMSEETKVKANEKLAAFTYKIGYPDKWKDFSSVDIQQGKLVQNIVNANKKKHRINMNKINKPVDKTEWGMTPQTVNAYYSATRNEIVFPAGILQAPFFDPTADDALNYGGIGAVIGHEFSHGFDDKGSKFDAFGNLANWWTEDDKARFEERTQKIVAQFNRFEVLDGVFINGNLTQGENIADLAGLTLAYYALKNKKAIDSTSQNAQDGFTWQQRLFLGWAQVWAQNIKEDELRQRIVTDPHAPGEYRVLGPLSNLPEFHEAFGCKPSHKLFANPQERVVIW